MGKQSQMITVRVVSGRLDLGFCLRLPALGNFKLAMMITYILPGGPARRPLDNFKLAMMITYISPGAPARRPLDNFS
jgi:hypothetical protein